MIWKGDLEKQNSLLPLEWGKLRSRELCLLAKFCFFSVIRGDKIRGSVRGRKQSQKSPNVQPGHPRAGWAGAARAVLLQGCRKEELCTFTCVLRDAPKEKDLLFCSCPSTDIGAKQNMLWLGFLEKHKGTENGVRNLSLRGNEQK